MLFKGREYYLAAILIIVISIFLFMWSFEKRKPKTREVVVLAVMTGIATLGRVMFKPCVAIIIITGIMLGKQSGFLCGALTAFVSDFFFGQGPWTPWQMFAFGIIGFISAIVFQKRKYLAYNKVVLCVYGFIMTFVVYGLILDTATVFMYTDRPKISSFMSTYAMGIPFNIVHGIATVVFLLLLAKPLFNKLSRMKEKYGMYNKKDNLN